jgi:hypothetical protein
MNFSPSHENLSDPHVQEFWLLSRASASYWVKVIAYAAPFGHLLYPILDWHLYRRAIIFGSERAIGKAVLFSESRGWYVVASWFEVSMAQR